MGICCVAVGRWPGAVVSVRVERVGQGAELVWHVDGRGGSSSVKQQRGLRATLARITSGVRVA